MLPKKGNSFPYGLEDHSSFRLAFTRLPVDLIEEGVNRLGKIINKRAKSFLSNKKKENKLIPLS